VLMSALGSGDARAVAGRGTASARLRARQEVPVSDRTVVEASANEASVRPFSRRTSRVLGGGRHSDAVQNSLVRGTVPTKREKIDVKKKASSLKQNVTASSVITNSELKSNVVGFEDEFPYLDENYDYSNYYYDYDVMPVQSIDGTTVRSVISTENLSSTKTIPHERNNKRKNKNNRNLTRGFVPLIRKGSRSSFVGASSRKISHISEKQTFPAKPPPIKNDSTKKLSGDRRETNKDNFMFKIFPRVKKNSTITLHERLQIHLNGDLATKSSTTVPTTQQTTENQESVVPIITTTEMHKPIALALSASPAHTVLISDDPESNVEETVPINTSTVKQEEIITSVPEVTTKNVSIADGNMKPANDNIKTNVTFSTSQTQQLSDPYPDVLSLSLLESQLGRAPSGVEPFGKSPFGEEPLGETPFGVQPEGHAPLGHHSLAALINQTSPSSGKNGSEGRYHVQVTAPNGSINGDYVVVDPATGNLNGVRYEAAKDVDPLIVHRALLNFLSLDPDSISIPSHAEQPTAPMAPHEQETTTLHTPSAPPSTAASEPPTTPAAT